MLDASGQTSSVSHSPSVPLNPHLIAAALPTPEFGSPWRSPASGPERIAPAVALRALIVEDDTPVRHACAEVAMGLGYTVDTAETLGAARTALARGTVDLVLLDLRLPGGNGATLLEEIHGSHPRAFVVVMTAFATVNSAVEMMRKGASDFLAKPFALEELITVLERAAEHRHWSESSRAVQERLRAGKGGRTLAGHCPSMDKVFRIVSKVAFTTHPVLIAGESGTGKEVVARAIHANGHYALHPFVPVDCGSLAPAQLEGELFGYARGALPGTARDKPGLLTTAGEGTVYLDEIGELSLDLQAKLVRVLHEKSIRPIGSSTPVPFRARLLASSTRDLDALVSTARFRKDLFYRLNVVNIRVPALRERRDDIPLLAQQILDRLKRERGVPYIFSDETLRLMLDYEWPGNVRELENTIERACALSSGPVLHLADLPTQLQNFQHDSHDRPAPEPEDQAAGVLTIQELERRAILGALQQLKGDKVLAARLLGIGKTTLYRKLKEYGISDDAQ